jgi:hypothetical protein
MLCLVVLVTIDVSEEPGTCIMKVTKVGELETTLAITRNRRTLRRNATRRNIPKDCILHTAGCIETWERLDQMYDYDPDKDSAPESYDDYVTSGDPVPKSHIMEQYGGHRRKLHSF